MPVRIAICDDSMSDIQGLKASLLSYDPLFEIEEYTSGKFLVDEIMKSDDSFDILFLDIYMPDLNGIEVAQKIREVKKDIKIIFITSSKDYYPQAYEVFAYNYIVKPFQLKQLYKVLDHAIEDIRKASGFKILIQYKSSLHNVDVKNIRYIESQNKLLLFHLDDERVLQCYGKVGEIINDLPALYFFRCHQSFIVNLMHVSEMGEDYFFIGKILIGISRKYKKEAKDRYFAFLFSQMEGRHSS